MMTQQRQALVIGNDKYANKPLPCCVNDAISMKQALSSMGFLTHCKTDCSISRMKAITHRFVQSIQPGDIVFFYFSGHGFQCDGINYLSPVDNDSMHDSMGMDSSALNVQKLIDAMNKQRPRLMIIILDACRNDDALKDMKGFVRKASTIIRPGFAVMAAPPATLIAYACAADEVSFGRSKYGNNSVYTYHLLRHIRTPDMDIDLVLRNVAADVQRETKNLQTPFRYSSCNEVICLVSHRFMNNLGVPRMPPSRPVLMPMKDDRFEVHRVVHHHQASPFEAPSYPMGFLPFNGAVMLPTPRHHH